MTNLNWPFLSIKGTTSLSPYHPLVFKQWALLTGLNALEDIQSIFRKSLDSFGHKAYHSRPLHISSNTTLFHRYFCICCWESPSDVLLACVNLLSEAQSWKRSHRLPNLHATAGVSVLNYSISDMMTHPASCWKTPVKAMQHHPWAICLTLYCQSWKASQNPA